MKKFLVIALAIVMVLSQGVCAFAAPVDETSMPLTSEGTVDVTVDDQSSHDIKYCVTVEWSETDMTYILTGEKEWMVDDELGHYYDRSNLSGEWKDNTAKVTVTNHSNAPIDADVAEDSNYENELTYTIAPAVFTLDAATEGTDYDAAPAQTATITATSDPEDIDPIKDHFVVTISAEEQATPTGPIELDIYNTDPLVFDVEKGAEYTFNASVMSLSAAQDENKEDPVNLDDYSYSQMTGIFVINDSYNNNVMYLEIMDDGMERYSVQLNIID